jgi:SAM-dependent methyltransferase
VDSSLWDAIARVERRHWWFRGRRELVVSVLRGRLPDGARVLDVGCGTGFVLERLLDHFDATGLEPDASVRSRALEPARSRMRAGSTGDLAAVEPASFDAVLLLDVLEHLDNDADALRAVRPLLRPGGFVLLTVPAMPWLWSSHDVRNEHRRRYTRRNLEQLLRQSGFSPIVLTHVNARLFPLALVHRAATAAFGTRTDRELSVPPRAVNELFTRLFAGEGRRARRGRSYGAGLSLLGLAEPLTP